MNSLKHQCCNPIQRALVPALRFASSSATKIAGNLCTSNVLRGLTYYSPSSHASGMALRLLAFLHLISVRTDLVRTECYYIWYWKASQPLHLDNYRTIARN